MSAVVTQDIEAYYIPGREARLHYTIRGADSETDAATALAATAPALYAGLPRQRREITTVFFDAAALDKNIFKGIAHYGRVTETDFVTSFDTTGGSQHVTQSLHTSSYGTAPPDMQGAIGFDGERVNGTEIVIPAFTFRETHVKTTTAVNTAYRNTLANLTGCVNNASFRGFAAGEVLFRGAAGRTFNDEGTLKWQMEYTFAASPNRTGMTIGGITGVAKSGWDYLWTLYGDDVDQSRLVQKPVAVYVERLYPQADFSDLGIGTN